MTNVPVKSEDADEKKLSSVLDEVPRGAIALSGLMVVLLLLGWFFVYLFIFIPRGTVG